jgi:hypothetical protein
MLTIHIHDEELAQQLQQIADREHRPVEAVLKTLLSQYPQPTASDHDQVKQEARQRVRLKVYTQARLYWQSVGDEVKAQLSDAALDQQFGTFDAAGIPRLKSELETEEPPVGSLAHAAKVLQDRDLAFETETPIDASKTDQLLASDFADDLFKRMNGFDAPK